MKKFHCPICNTTYKYKSMADRCIKTTTCKSYNSPDQYRLHAYITQICILTVIQFFVYPFCEQYKNNDVLLKIFKKMKHYIDTIYTNIGILFVNPDFVKDKQKTLVNALTSLWPLNKEFNLQRMVYLLKNLIHYTINNLSNFWLNHDNFQQQKDAWCDILSLISNINECISLSYEDMSIVNNEVNKIIEIVFPKEKSNNKHLCLYLLNNKFWITAFNRNEARDVLLNTYGIICKNIVGINPEEKMEDGRTAQDMIDMAAGQQKIIGRTE